MFSHYMQFCLRGMQRHPVLTGLVVLVIVIAVAAAMTRYSAYRNASRHPGAQKSEPLYSVQIDNWGLGPREYPDRRAANGAYLPRRREVGGRMQGPPSDAGLSMPSTTR